MNPAVFNKKTTREELEMLLSHQGDITPIIAYLNPLIRTSISKSKFGFSNTLQEQLYKEIESDMPVAIDRFLSKKNAGDGVHFSAYFSWYIAQRINALLKKRTLWEKIRAALSFLPKIDLKME